MKNKNLVGYKFTISSDKTKSNDIISCEQDNVTFLKKLFWFYFMELKKKFANVCQLYMKNMRGLC